MLCRSLGLMLWALAGCADLPEVPASACGNGVVEEGIEDCDTVPGARTATVVVGGQTVQRDATCRAKGTIGECRYDCAEDGSGEKHPCPDGYACGTDDICRAPSGTFEAFGQAIAASGSLGLADFDGDGRLDVMVANASFIGGTEVFFLDPEGAVVSQSSLPISGAGSARLTGDGQADILALEGVLVGLTEMPAVDPSGQSAPGGLDVLRGQRDRTFASTSYATSPIAPTLRLVPLDAIAGERGKLSQPSYKNFGGSELLAIDTTTGDIRTVDRGLVGNVVMTLAEALPSDARIRSGRLAPSSLTESLVLNYGKRLHVFSPSIEEAKWNTQSPGSLMEGPSVNVTLADTEAPIADFWFVDVDADGYRDLVIAAGKRDLFIAYGSAAGFDGGEGGPSGVAAEVKLEIFPKSVRSLVGFSKTVAVADLNGDGLADFATTIGLLLSDASGGDVVHHFVDFDGREAKEAVIADFNGDGRQDVVIATLDGQLTYLLNAGGDLFNPFVVPLEGAAHDLGVGDLDGDLLPDVAFAEATRVSPEDGTEGPLESKGNAEKKLDRLSVLFGRPTGVFEGPFALGTLGKIRQVVPGRDLAAVDEDGRFDLAVVSEEDEKHTLAVFAGRQDRNLTSAFQFFREGSPRAGIPLQALAARFENDADRDGIAVTVQDEDGSWLWRLRASGEAVLAADEPQLLHVGYPVASVLPASGKPASLVFFAQPGTLDPNRSALQIAKPAANGFAFGNAIVVDEWFFGGSAYYADFVEQRAVTACSGDFDADGFPDVATSGNDSTRDALLIFWGTQDGGLLEKPEAIPIGDGDFLSAFICLRAHAGKGTDLAVVGVGTRLVSCEGRSCAFSDVETLLPPSGSLVAADVTGDGIDDIVLIDAVGKAQTRVFAGIPSIR